MNESIKNKVEIFKQICIYELNQVQITSETISTNNGSQRCFEFVIKNINNEIICLGEMPPVNNIDNYIKSIEDKIEKGLLDYSVFIYSIKHDKIMYITPYREWPSYDFEIMGMTTRQFLIDLKSSCIDFKHEDDLEFDRLDEEIKNLKQNNSEYEKKYEKLKSDSELYKKIYKHEIEKLEKQIESNKRNELDRLKHEFDKIKNNVDLLTPLRKMNLAEKCEYSFSFQKDEIIAKVDKFWYFEGGKDEVARWSDSGCNYFRMDLDNMEYEEITDNRYSDIINWLRIDM